MTDENKQNNSAPLSKEQEEHPNTVEFKRLQESIAQHRQQIAESMDKLNFTEEEKKEINDILDYHTLLKEAAKTPLIRIDENSVLDKVENKVNENIKDISDNMLKAAKAKMKEIMDRKLQK